MSPFPPCGTRRTAVKGQQELELRTLSAWEAVEAGREAETLEQTDRETETLEQTDRETETLEQTDRETALCVNACILARALERRGKALFPDGEAVLRALSVAQIADLARQWAEFSREHDPSPRDPKAVERLKKAWSTRLMRAFSGVCSGLLGRYPRRRGPGR